MQVVETRLLEGPNIFLPIPAVKIELRSKAKNLDGAAALEEVRQLIELVLQVHERLNLQQPEIVCEPLETPGHFALAFSWERRAFAKHLAQLVVRSRTERVSLSEATAECSALLTEPAPEGDVPEMMRDADRKPITIAVTGTNGKTTTTRLVAHIFTLAGKRAGWSSSSGVYIAGEEVLKGDYSGLRGALRVLEDPSVEVAVIETARGGILIKGIACESVDVSVLTNVSGDHLELHGIRTVQGLARVKSVVSRITRTDGFAVLNADDPLVMESTRGIRARPFLVSQLSDNPLVVEHVSNGGLAMVNDGSAITLLNGSQRTVLTAIEDIPMTFRGLAGFMVENALCGAAAAYAAGATVEQVTEGLRTFVNSAEQNPGRLNVFDLDGIKIILDFAHNEVGLVVLLDFAHSLVGEQAKVISVIGTAGDRNDAALRELGRIAATWSDHVIAKGTRKYLRGRELDDLIALYVDGIRSVNGAHFSEAVGELTAVQQAIAMASPGDAVAIMAQEEIQKIQQHLQSIGAKPV